MAIVANTFTKFDAIGVREALSDVISNIAPDETPIQSNAARETVKNTDFEWQQDTLAAQAANAQLEGDDITSFTAVVPTVRIKNYTQISRKTLVLSGTQEAVDSAGRKSELAYQMAKNAKELKRDIEHTLCANVAGVAGNTTTARKTGSFLTFIKTNTSKGATGADPTTPATTARTDGTPRALTEAFVKTVCSAIWTQGGTLKMAVMGATQKQAFSALAGIATNRYEVKGNKPTTIIGAADAYVSDFGVFNVVPDRFMRPTTNMDILFLDPEMYALCILRPYQTVELAKTGDAEKRMLLIEWGLKVKNEKGLGLITDLS